MVRGKSLSEVMLLSMIEEYHFGSITINGKTYDYDIEVRCDGVVLKWWRQESHKIAIEDIKRAIEQKPDIIVIGTGESGLAKVLDETKEKILSEGITLIIRKTTEAVKTFNKMCERSQKDKEQKRVIGLFHLTC